MDYKRTKADSSTVTRDNKSLNKLTDNMYETVSLLSKRANQISQDIKQELYRKIEEFTTQNDTLEEIFENREQIEIARFYEQLPKATLIAIHEYLNDELVYRNEENGKGVVQDIISELNEVTKTKEEKAKKTKK